MPHKTKPHATASLAAEVLLQSPIDIGALQ